MENGHRVLGFAKNRYCKKKRDLLITHKVCSNYCERVFYKQIYHLAVFALLL